MLSDRGGDMGTRMATKLGPPVAAEEALVQYLRRHWRRRSSGLPDFPVYIASRESWWATQKMMTDGISDDGIVDHQASSTSSAVIMQYGRLSSHLLSAPACVPCACARCVGARVSVLYTPCVSGPRSICALYNCSAAPARTSLCASPLACSFISDGSRTVVAEVGGARRGGKAVEFELRKHMGAEVGLARLLMPCRRFGGLSPTIGRFSCTMALSPKCTCIYTISSTRWIGSMLRCPSWSSEPSNSLSRQ